MKLQKNIVKKNSYFLFNKHKDISLFLKVLINNQLLTFQHTQ